MMKITWFGHSAFRLDFASNVVLIDPFFTGNPAFQGSVEKASEGVTHILITHGHADHIGDAPTIGQKTGAKVITNYDLCMYLAKQGITNFDPMNTGGTTEQDGFTTTLVRADHSSGLVEMDVHFPLGSANGFIISIDAGPTVYHMGDTDIFGDMALIQELYEPDVIFVPIGGRFTMGPKTAALALKRFFKPKAVFPCHYGSFSLIESNADNFIEAMDGSGIQVVVPQKGLGVRI